MGKFQRGASGNPMGRPPRSDSEKAQREAIRAALPGIIETLVGLAQGGDTQAARLLMDRALPALRPVERARTAGPWHRPYPSVRGRAGWPGRGHLDARSGRFNCWRPVGIGAGERRHRG